MTLAVKGDSQVRSFITLVSDDKISLRVFLQGSGGEGSIYLDGTLERSSSVGRCVYTDYSGTVWFVGFDTEEIGTFVATRAP
jgi:hypothetical protein